MSLDSLSMDSSSLFLDAMPVDVLGVIRAWYQALTMARNAVAVAELCATRRAFMELVRIPVPCPWRPIWCFYFALFGVPFGPL